MNFKFLLFAIVGCLMLAVLPALRAQCITTNSIYTDPKSKNFPIVLTLKYHDAVMCERTLGEHSLLPPGLKDKMKLTYKQCEALKPFEDDFASMSQQYEVANQFRIDAAGDVSRQVRGSKNAAQIRAARSESQAAWAGLQPYRDSAVNKIKPLLTTNQIAILEDPLNQWHENHVYEAHDPSAN
jgi:hypothetical protein